MQETRATQEYSPRRRKTSRRDMFVGGCLSIGGALFAFGCVFLIVAAIIAPSVYRSLRPELQEVWCYRAGRVQMDFVCDWKPTPPFEFVPTLPSSGSPTIDPIAFLTQIAATPISGAASPALMPTTSPAATESSALPTPLPAASATLPPTATPRPTDTPPPTATPTLTPVPLPLSYRLDKNLLAYQAQTWNNCGPATLSMGLSYFGYRRDQSVAASYLKPNREDKNVSPYQVVNYVNQVVSQQANINAMYRIGGNFELLKRLIANNFPVIIEKGYEVEDKGWMGHYLLLMGYDDTAQEFYSFDSYLGAGPSNTGRAEAYEETRYYWRHFNNLFIVLYAPDRQQELLTLLGAHADPHQAEQIALEVAQQEATANNNDGWAWFNMGAAYTLLGQYDLGATAFDKAFSLNMPWRTLWYLHTPFNAYLATGRYNDILALSQVIESNTSEVEESYFYRGAVLALQGDAQGAVTEFSRTLTHNSNFEAAQAAITAVQNGTFTQDMILQIGVGG